MILKIKLMLKNEFFKNILTLMTGTAIAQAIPLLFSPLLTRLYTPDDFGELGFLVSIYSILAILFTFRYEQAIMLPEKDKDADKLFKSSLIISTIILFLTYFILLIIFKYLNIDETKYNKNILFLIPLISYLFAFNQINIQYSNRYKNFKRTSTAKVLLFLSITTLQILFYFLYIGLNGLIIGQISGFVIIAIFWSYKNGIKLDFYKINKKVIKILLKYKDFPKFVMPNSFLNTLSGNLPNLLIIVLFSKEYAGYYLLSHKIVMVPMSLITSSISQVFYQKASKGYAKKQNLYPLIKKLYLGQIKLGILPVLIAFVFAPYLFSIFFGEKWYQAGIYTRYLLPWLFMVFLNNPISGIINITNNQKKYLIIEIFLVIFRVGAIFLGKYYFHSPSMTVLLFASVSFLFHLYIMYFLIFKLRKHYEFKSLNGVLND